MINNASAATHHGAAVVGRFWTRAALRRLLLLSDVMMVPSKCLPAVVLRATDLVALR